MIYVTNVTTMLLCLPRKPHHVNAFVRHFNLFEYQVKTILAEHGCNIQRFCLLEEGNQANASDHLAALKAPQYIVKAQIESGDRGRGIFTSGFRGGVHLTRSHQEALEIARRMLGQVLVTNETGEAGARVNKVVVAEHVEPFKTKHVCFSIDCIHGPTIFVADASGDDVHANTANVFHVPLSDRLGDTVVKGVVDAVHFGDIFRGKVEQHLHVLWTVFNKYHALCLAVNPLALSINGEIICLEAKLVIDDNAMLLPCVQRLLRQDPTNETRLALKKLDYVKLAGNIGCFVDGAGLALATNDLIASYGGRPGNFLNLNLTTKNEEVDNERNLQVALDEVLKNKKITSLLVNINWNSDCLQVARTLIEGKLKLPIVLRLKGMNDEAAWKLLEASPLKIYKVNDTEEAARKIVALSDVSEKLSRNK